MGGFARGASPGFEAGRAPHSAAVRLVALGKRFRTATGEVVAHDAVRGAIVGAVCALGVALLLWQTFWHDLVNVGLAVGVSTLVAAVLLVVPMRAIAGAFALILSLSIVGLSAFYFATGGSTASAGASAAVQDATTQEVGGSDPANELAPADPDPAVIDSQTDAAMGSLPSSSGGQRYGATVFNVPETSRPGSEPVTPCHYRSRAWRSTGEKWSVAVTGPCSSRATTSP